MDLLERYQTSTEAEVSGVWHKLPDLDVELKIARHGNEHYLKRQREMVEPYLDRIRTNEKMTEEEGKPIDDQLFAECILVGWRIASTKEEVLILGENRIPYSVEACLKLIKLEGMRDFREMVLRISTKQARYRQSALENSEKNSSALLSESSGADKTKSNGSEKSLSEPEHHKTSFPSSVALSH